MVAGLVVAAAACDSAELVLQPGHGGAGGGGANTQGGGGVGNTIITGGTGGTGGIVDPCAATNCPFDQHCDGGACINNTCQDLACSPTEVCEPTPGGGAYCKDVSCTDDVECPASQYCDGTVCVDDICVPGERHCQGQMLYQCASNGGLDQAQFTCGSSAYFVSTCVDDGSGDAYCGCEDDWDCPSYTECEAGKCQGTGVAPTCFLAPEPFSNVLPSNEITWGGTFASPVAAGSPFPNSVQVVMSPTVANLDDDNGDGLVNELDFPEIVFVTFCNSDFTSNGVLRAIHGGGAAKGGDFFATCGTTTWHEGDDPASVTCTCGSATLDSTASVAIGDLDYDGVPEIVALSETTHGIQIFDNLGNRISASAINIGYPNPAPALANLDNQGLAEVVIGRNVFTLEKDGNGDLQVLDRFQGTLQNGQNGQGPASCVANIVGDERQEIIAGTSVYRMPTPPAGVTRIADCAPGDPSDFCQGRLTVVWDGQTVNGAAALPNGQRDGFCAIADVLGADQVAAPGPQNPLDGAAEVIVIANGYEVILNGQDGTLRRFVNISEGNNGGPPNVDDFDGDGFPEIGTAFGAGYVVIDLQDPTAACPAWPTKPANDATTAASVNPPRTPPAIACAQDSDCEAVTPGTACNEQTSSCVCLHNGWKRTTEDDSSRVTGSTVFDFNGDGAAEVIYNDECRFRIYDGTDASVWFAEPSESRTRIEYPIVADVDNDGNAEIVFATTTESGFCSQNLDSSYNAGIEVWGDAGDFWVAARRIWNQHAYSITNVTESALLPLKPPESWKTYGNRRYNTFRSNPRTLGTAPDLTPTAVQVSSPNATCGQLSTLLDITVQIKNQGDVRVGPGVVVGFHGTWSSPALSEPLHADLAQTPLRAVLQTSIEPGDSIFLTVSYDASWNAPGVLPDTVTVVVDETSLERECDESNNEIDKPVAAGTQLPDLRISLGVPAIVPTCPTLPTTVYNDGSAPASDVLVRYYQGNPSQGGTALHDVLLPGPIAPQGSVTFDEALPLFPQGVSIQVWAVVDPLDTIEECNDGNNADAADQKVQCGGIN